MTRIRVIPVLLVNGTKLVKTIKFKNATYVGDPINAVKIFNDKEVDELILLDITATVENRKPNVDFISKITNECFMPLCYGGGIKNIDQIKTLLNMGIEKIALNTSAVENTNLITEAANLFGNQSIVVSIDVRKNIFGKYSIFTRSGKKNMKTDPVKFAKEMEDRGAGEIMLNSIDRDGTYLGYDLELIHKMTDSVNIPLIASGGARNVNNFVEAVKSGASAVSAGSMFVFHGKHRAVLINFPSQEELKSTLYQTKN